MPYYCTVPRCTSMAGKAKNVSFHQFPRDEELAKLWNNILKRGKPYTKYSKVCSLHFKPEDYTITSVGKNKGQWRTLRKDAIPSQNLPSDSPAAPYQRRQSGVWVPNSLTTNVIDARVQQQVAQAIYMQTMLAMQASSTSNAPTINLVCNGSTYSTSEDSNNSSLNPPFTHTSGNISDMETIVKGKKNNACFDDTTDNILDRETSSFKCIECSKCFKDPDVFILHKRTHVKGDKEIAHSGSEKENLNVNSTLKLQANPILANLLKTNIPEGKEANIFDNNILSIENHIMTALAANMENYIRNLSTMMKSNEGDDDRNNDDDESQGFEPNCDRDLNESLDSNNLVIDESV